MPKQSKMKTTTISNTQLKFPKKPQAIINPLKFTNKRVRKHPFHSYPFPYLNPLQTAVQCKKLYGCLRSQLIIFCRFVQAAEQQAVRLQKNFVSRQYRWLCPYPQLLKGATKLFIIVTDKFLKILTLL